jgi:hypothetical protein
VALKVVQDFIPPGRRNRPGLPLRPVSLTVHTTGNPRAGAADHARYVKGPDAAARPASWHYTVGEDGVFQHLPEDEVAWHAGDGESGPGNRTSLALEICENVLSPDGRIAPHVLDLAAELVADVCRRYGWPPDEVHIVPHRRWSGKNCPNPARLDLAAFRRLVAERMRRQGALTPILGPPSASPAQARAWARTRGAAEEFLGLAALYWTLAPRHGGVDPAVAYAQAAKETAFGRFGGAVTPSHRNPGGLKTRDARGDRPEDHARFPDWETGVAAHLDHLALYAGAPGYPRRETPDPRHFPGLAGTAPHVEELSGRWAPDPDYGRSIVRDYLLPLRATPTPPDSPAAGEQGADPCAGLHEELATWRERAERAEGRARRAEAELERIREGLRRLIG